jgi:hypothetical protein
MFRQIQTSNPSGSFTKYRIHFSLAKVASEILIGCAGVAALSTPAPIYIFDYKIRARQLHKNILFVLFRGYFNEFVKIAVILFAVIIYNIILSSTLRIYAGMKLPKYDAVSVESTNRRLYGVAFCTLFTLTLLIAVPVAVLELFFYQPKTTTREAPSNNALDVLIFRNPLSLFPIAFSPLSFKL